MNTRSLFSCFLGVVITLCTAGGASAQSNNEDAEFGPVVRAYLGYLRNEQEVVDDRASRHEVNQTYYRRNSNRIRALRLMTLKIATANQNDYLPELEAVAGDEFGLILERPPRAESLRIGEVLQTTFRYLGVVRAGEPFYVFARLDPYEQSDLMDGKQITQGSDTSSVGDPAKSRPITRARRVTDP